MKYPAKILLRVAEEVIEKHPDLAASIMDRMPIGSAFGNGDLTRIPSYLNSFCDLYSTVITGPLHNQTLTESRKVFIGAMASVYQGQPRFNKLIGELLNMAPSSVATTIQETSFRYKKDPAFRARVDQFKKTISL